MTIYQKQWEGEIERFMSQIKVGNYFMGEKCIMVGYNDSTWATNDPRVIQYDFEDCRLRDDHFCAQHSRTLTCMELKDIFYVLKNEGVDVTTWDIYYAVLEAEQ